MGLLRAQQQQQQLLLLLALAVLVVVLVLVWQSATTLHYQATVVPVVFVSTFALLLFALITNCLVPEGREVRMVLELRRRCCGGGCCCAMPLCIVAHRAWF